jgi:hypothetical protein
MCPFRSLQRTKQRHYYYLPQRSIFARHGVVWRGQLKLDFARIKIDHLIF